MDSEITIRTAAIEDAQALLDIYAYYVEETAITYEYDVPSLAEFKSRIAHTLERYPYLVAEMDGDDSVFRSYGERTSDRCGAIFVSGRNPQSTGCD